jgi:hypothetical protein
MRLLTKEEFDVLWNITNSWKKSPAHFVDNDSDGMHKYGDIFQSLSELGLIKVEFRDGVVYGAVETASGREICSSSKYDSWKS